MLVSKIKVGLCVSISSLIVSSCASAENVNQSYLNAKGEVCKPNVTYIYQPPISLGKSGSVRTVKVGETCVAKSKKKKKTKKKTDLDPTNASCETYERLVADILPTGHDHFLDKKITISQTCKRDNLTQTSRITNPVLAFESKPSGLEVEIFEKDQAPAFLSCKTPCLVELPDDKGRFLSASAKLTDGTTRKLPVGAYSWTKTFFTEMSSNDTILEFIPLVPTDMTTAVLTPEAKPLIRIPPAWNDIAGSGDYCDLVIDVGPSGNVMKTKVEFCSNETLIPSALSTAMKWRYNPRIIEGDSVGRRGVIVKMSKA